MEDIDKDMLKRLNRQGGNGPRNRSSANPSLQEFYHTPGPDDKILQPIIRYGQSLEGNNTRIGDTIECDPRTNRFSAPSAAEQHEQQVMDKLNSRGPTQQSTPIVISQGYRAPVSSVTSRTTHWGPESTTRTHVDQRRKSTSLPPVSIPPKAFGHPRDSHHPTQPTIQRTTNNRPNQHATQMMNFNYGNRPTQQSPPVATPQVNRAHTNLVPQSAAHEGPRSETGIQAEGKRRLVQFASGSASLPSRAHGYSSHHPIQSTSQTIQRMTNDKPRTVHHRNVNSVSSQISPKTIEPRERVGAIAGPSTTPRQNVASTIDTNHAQTQVSNLGPQPEWVCQWCARKFETSLAYSKHKDKRLDLTCNMCPVKICYKSDLEAHVGKRHGQKLFYCGHCFKIDTKVYEAFEKYGDFERHKLKDHSIKKYQYSSLRD